MKKAGGNEKNGAEPQHGRGGKLKIDLPFEEAVRAALETPPEHPPTKKVFPQPKGVRIPPDAPAKGAGKSEVPGRRQG